MTNTKVDHVAEATKPLGWMDAEQRAVVHALLALVERVAELTDEVVALRDSVR